MSDRPFWGKKVPKSIEQGFSSKLTNRAWQSQSEAQETPNSRILYLKNVVLQSPKPQIVAKVDIEVKPLKKLEIGDKVGTLIFDQITPKMQEMSDRVIAECQNLEDCQKPRKVMEIMLEFVQYAFAQKMENQSEEVQNVAKSSGCNFSDLVDAGFGVCRHLSPLYVWLIQQAGLSAIVQSNGGGTDKMKNVYKISDGKITSEPLFKLTPVGQSLGGHAWVLVFLLNKKVILVDPSTKLVSDNPDDLQTVHNANYSQIISLCIDAISTNGERLDAINETRYFTALKTNFEVKISIQDPKMQETGGFFKQPKVPPQRDKFGSSLVKITLSNTPYSYLVDNYKQEISNLQKI